MSTSYLSDDLAQVIDVLPLKQLNIIESHLKIRKIGIVRVRGKRLTSKPALLGILREIIVEEGPAKLIEALRIIPLCFIYYGLSDVNVFGFKTQLQPTGIKELHSTNIHLFENLETLKNSSQLYVFFPPTIANMNIPEETSVSEALRIQRKGCNFEISPHFKDLGSIPFEISIGNFIDILGLLI
ncbi:hypothetical protein BC833DRAFT_568007 [Globomyces pollinis-pini]|nr:hypothetical protein BC833DRAFT_568007 [Globomyces pollinis-pini]